MEHGMIAVSPNLMYDGGEYKKVSYQILKDIKSDEQRRLEEPANSWFQHHQNNNSPGSKASQQLMRNESRTLTTTNGQQSYSIPRAHPTAMARRNERERKRVRMVNMGFATLRQYLPHVGRKKLSKMETLRSAIDYIKQLQLLLHNENQENSTYDHSTNSPLRQDVTQWTAVPLTSMTKVEKIHHGCHYYSAPMWEDAATATGWSTPRSPDSTLGSEASSPPTSLSPEEEILDFAFS